MGITINKKTIFTGLLMLLAGNIQAFNNVKLNASVSGSMYYTDNVNLDYTNEKSNLVGRISPSIGLSTKGSRVRTQVNYTMSGLTYNKDSGNDDIYHNLSSSANAEIVKQSIFLDGFANVRQVLLDQNKNASSDLVSGSNNTTETYTYGLTPSWKKKWGNYASSVLSYGYNEVKFSGGGNSDSTGQNVNLTVSSGTKFNQYFWDLNSRYSETSYQSSGSSLNARDTTSEASYVTLGYHYSRRLDLRVRLGYEDYDRTVSDGFGWTVGGNWRPSQRTSLDASWGERAFGRTASLDFNHRSKRLTWQVNYSDSITNSRGQIIQDSQAINNANLNPGNVANVNVPLSTYDANLRLTRRLTGSSSYRFSKSTITLGVFAEAIYYKDEDKKDNLNQGINLSWNINVSSRSSLTSRVSWTQLDDRQNQTNNKQDRKDFSLSFTRSLNPELSGSINYTYRNNSADLRTSEYTENRISATLTKSF